MNGGKAKLQNRKSKWLWSKLTNSLLPARSIGALPAECGPEGGSDCVSREQFERNYQGKRPVLLSGLIGDWPAMTRWTKRAFVEGYGTHVEVRIAPANSFSILAVSKLHP